MWSRNEHVEGVVLVWTGRGVVDEAASEDEDDEVARVHATMVDVEGCPGESMSIEIVFGCRYPFKQPAFLVSDELNTAAAFRAVSNTIESIVSHWSPATTVEMILEQIYGDMLRIHRHRAACREADEEVASVEFRRPGRGPSWHVHEPLNPRWRDSAPECSI